MASFQIRMQDQYDNYWKRHSIVWHELLMVKAAFMPYLPHSASCPPASLTIGMTKPHWGSHIICVIKFISAKSTRSLVHVSQCHTRSKLMIDSLELKNMRKKGEMGEKNIHTDYIHILRHSKNKWSFMCECFYSCFEPCKL